MALSSLHPLALGNYSQDLETQERPQEIESNLAIEQGSRVRQKVLQDYQTQPS